MKIEQQVCTEKQGKALHDLGIKLKPKMYHLERFGIVTAYEDFPKKGEMRDEVWASLNGRHKNYCYPAYTLSELLDIVGHGTKMEELLWQRLLNGINSNIGLTHILTAKSIADFILTNYTTA